MVLLCFFLNSFLKASMVRPMACRQRPPPVWRWRKRVLVVPRSMRQEGH